LGRLFDAVAGITGVCRQATFEGQAAVALEAAVTSARVGSYDVRTRISDGAGLIDTGGFIESVLSDTLGGTDPGVVSARFHNTLVRVASSLASALAEENGLRRVVLSGGSFQNGRLRQGIEARLARKKLSVYRNRLVPTNDGGISLGQAVIAASDST
jgi:hydrogenase maturation protein HypF